MEVTEITNPEEESILDQMNDSTFEGAIGSGIKTAAGGDTAWIQTSVWHNDWYDEGTTVDHWREWYEAKLIPQVPIIPQVPREMFRIHDPEIDDIIQAHRGESDPKEKAYDKVYTLLADCLHRKDRSFEKAEQAVQLIEQHSLSKFNLHLVRGLVHFPDLLKRFLAVLTKEGANLDDDDLGIMICRCIEHRPDDRFALSSLKQLLKFKGHRSLEIKLLPKKYNIDSELYEMAQWEDVHDSYFDATHECKPFVYSHMDVVKKEAVKYTGFRDAYHCLLYGGLEHLQALIVRWDLWGDDCTADAAREFFGFPPETPLVAVRAQTDRRSMVVK